MPEKRKIRIQKENGEIEYIDIPQDKPKILHHVLEDILLKRIRVVYSQ